MALSTVHTESTDNQSDRGHTVWHFLLYIQRATSWNGMGGEVGHRGHIQPDAQGAQTVGHTGVLLVVHAEGTDNQSDSKVPYWSIVY